ncbi:MAG: acyl-CoA dehydratase activase [Lachnospiraceae bacterium]|nr:acyl-CoA dehydratase activase [Lachnospiraceae bacterium]
MEKTLNEKNREETELCLGIDVGSTTVKAVVVCRATGEMLYHTYVRHNARQLETVCEVLRKVEEQFPGAAFRTAICGSGGKPLAEAAGVPFIQEVVANASAIRARYPQVRTAVELGGQDAKVIFFHYDESTQSLNASDMRMNGSCAGGTGAFIDEIAALLDVKTEEFESLAAAGTTVYNISGRCGVFAKTDIQPLLIQGAKKEDIALSVFHAIVHQTIGGLSQGLELTAPIIFEGGPLTFNPTLIRAFADELHLKEEEIVVPEHPETIVAYGAAIAAGEWKAPRKKVAVDEGVRQVSPNEDVQTADKQVSPNEDVQKVDKPYLETEVRERYFECDQKKQNERGGFGNGSGSVEKEGKKADIAGDFENEINRSGNIRKGANNSKNVQEDVVSPGELIARFRNNVSAIRGELKKPGRPFFATEEEKQAFCARHESELMDVCVPEPVDGVLSVYLGIDSGSTTSKLVLLDERERVVDRFYANNHGDPLRVICGGLTALEDKYRALGIRLDILGVGTTGYGEKLFAGAFQADYHVVETVAHSEGCRHYYPDATFLLDIGGQDMKAIWLKDGVITNMMLNEACSSGCGSFLENFALTLGIPVEEIAEAAFRSQEPANLGSRCTVFMNSTIINEQREGRQPDDIMAGLCRSIIENVFTKVVRVSNTDELGDRIVVQGGTFRNMAVRRAIEEYLGREVSLAPYPGEMGAVGVAILTKRKMEEMRGVSQEDSELCTNGQSRKETELQMQNSGENSLDDTGETKRVREMPSEEGGSQELRYIGLDAVRRPKSRFIGLGAVRNFTYTTETGVICPHCANHCARTIMRFGTGGVYVTGNRCERGAVVEKLTENTGKTVDVSGRKNENLKEKRTAEVPDLFLEREKLLFADWPCDPACDSNGKTVGIPRTLEFWDSAPFWSTFFRALGYEVKFSHRSSRKMYEAGLTFVASDTICFPAKLVHGHILDLAKQGVDRIFMPYVMHMPPEGVDKQSPYVCSVVQGYPMVVRNSQTPEERYGVKFDTPVFHWFSEKNRKKQILKYAQEELGVFEGQAEAAFLEGEKAITEFRTTLRRRAEEIMEDVRETGSYAVVLAGRPYHTDAFISHDISKKFTRRGIPVLTVDSLPGLNEVNPKNTRIEITNNFHTRMLSGAVLAAETPELEYVQLVSFGCGHDAVLSDEIVRDMNAAGNKPPLILKIDESDASGALDIRIQSFLETVAIRRKKEERIPGGKIGASDIVRSRENEIPDRKTGDRNEENGKRGGKLGNRDGKIRNHDGKVENCAGKTGNKNNDKSVNRNGESRTREARHKKGEIAPGNPGALVPAPSPVKFYRPDKKKRTILIPNISAEVNILLCAILEKENFIPKAVPVGQSEQIRLGKKYVHNDICFPCQMVIGELIGELQTGNYRKGEVAVGMVKFQCDCRMSHYTGLLRKGLDAAGFTEVPIVTTDVGDSKDMHPGIFLLGVSAVLEAVWTFMMLDILTELCRKIRPYELNPGETDRVYQACVQKLADGIRKSIHEARKAFETCISDMADIPYDRSVLKPRVFVTGELLVTYHPGSNFGIERYLEKNNMEAVFPRVTDQLRKDFQATMAEIKDYQANIFPYPFAVDWLFDTVQKNLEKVAVRHPLYEKSLRPRDIYEGVRDIIPETLSCGEGWLMAAEIDHYARKGVKSFVILQPFGCLPNHICGRGVIRRLKERYPEISILPLDLDPDTSFANVENRLQMLLMNCNLQKKWD